MTKGWIILLGVICARTYKEFDRAYSKLKRRQGPKSSSIDLWKCISGQMATLESERITRRRAKKKKEK